jgi:CHAT domain-containing protein
MTIQIAQVWTDDALKRKEWNEIAEAYGFGAAAAGKLIAAQDTRYSKENWIRTAEGLARSGAYALAMLGDAAGAATAFERGRALLLMEKIEQDSAGSLTAAGSTPRLPVFRDIQAAAAFHPIVYVTATKAGGCAVIVLPDGTAWTLSLPMLTQGALSARVEAFRAAYDRRSAEPGGWLGTLDAVTRWLWDAVMWPLFKATEPDEEITLVPLGQLGLLPLHAAWTADQAAPTGRRYALDVCAIGYAPNARSLAYAREKADSTTREGILIVSDPRPVRAEPLRFSSAEAASAAACFSDGEAKFVEHEDAKPATILEFLPHYPVLHMICHGISRPQAPLDSAFLLSGDVQWSLRDLLSLQLTHARLAVLSACETDMRGTELPDESVSLSTAMVGAGFAGVIASQWAVPDLHTAALMLRFYVHWRVDGLSPGQALRLAQQWVRDSTNAEKADFFRDAERCGGRKQLDQATRDLWRAVRVESPGARSSAHIWHWAAFTLVGT